MSETRKYRKFTAQQKLELVMASLRGERSRSPSSAASTRSPRRCCGAGAIRCSRPAASAWPAAGALAWPTEQRKRIAELERALGQKTYELEILGNGFRAWE